MTKLYRAVPRPDERPPGDEVLVPAEDDVAALDGARGLLGSAAPFDLWDGTRFVLAYRPTQRLRRAAPREPGPP